jgi:organic hydroperoxide reductase OsmC/OhrA
MGKAGDHTYPVHVEWTGNLGVGTRDYRSYEREHVLSVPGKPTVPMSSDPAFRGDPTRYNPEELLVAALSGCHMLWYLHLCSDAGITVTEYRDDAQGRMRESRGGGGRFTEVVLRPVVTVIGEENVKLAIALHERAHDLCYIASSVNFTVRCQPVVRTAHAPGETGDRSGGTGARLANTAEPGSAALGPVGEAS